MAKAAQTKDSGVLEFTIHDRLRKAREHAGLEQGELAERIEVSRQTIGNYERGDISTPKKLVVRQWALATGVDLDWLWSGSDHPHTPAGKREGRAGLTDLGEATSPCTDTYAGQTARAA